MLKFGVGLVLVSTAVSVGVGMGPAQAAPPPDGAATIVRGAECTIRTDQGIQAIVTTDMQAVITPSGRVNLVCRGRVPAGTVAPFHQSGFLCSIGPAGFTTDSHVVWNAAGNGTLTCHGGS